MYLHPCSNGLVMADQKTISDSESKSYCKIIGFEKNGVKSSCLLDMLNSSEYSGAKSRPIAVEAKVKTFESSMEDQFLFSNIDGFVLDGTRIEKSFKADDEKNKPHLNYAKLEGAGSQRLKDVSDEELYEGFIEESVTQTSPMTIPRNRTYLEDFSITPKSLPAIRSSIHDLERSNRPRSLSSSFGVIMEKTEGNLSRLKCSNNLNMEDGSKSKMVQDYCTYEAVASTLDTKNDHAPKGIAIHPIVGM